METTLCFFSLHKIRNTQSVVSIIVCFVLICSAYIFYPYIGNRNQKVAFSIQQGKSLTEIGKKLRDQGLIHSTVVFKFITRIIGKGGQLKSGDYSINGRQSLMEIIYKLDKGVGVLVTLREGLRMSEIFKILEENGIGKIKAYETLSRDQKFISTFKLYHKLKNLEGFLFPETYYFSKKDNEKNVLRKIIMTFKKKLPEFFSKKSKKVGLTSYEAIILASIIEKETGVAKERKLISSVFHNRLKKKMRLETDPSVIYGIKSFDGNLTRWHLRKKPLTILIELRVYHLRLLQTLAWPLFWLP